MASSFALSWIFALKDAARHEAAGPCYVAEADSRSHQEQEQLSKSSKVWQDS